MKKYILLLSLLSTVLFWNVAHASITSSSESPLLENTIVSNDSVQLKDTTKSRLLARFIPVAQTKVDVMPQFTGGVNEMEKFISDNLKYPDEAIEDELQGEVVLRFLVTKNGEINDGYVYRSLSAECDAEALRVLRAMPKWKAGKKDGKSVDTNYTLRIFFDFSKVENEDSDSIIYSQESEQSTKNDNDEQSKNTRRVRHSVILAKKAFTPADILPQYQFSPGIRETENLIQTRLKHPKDTVGNEVFGDAYLFLFITKDGDLENIDVQQSFSSDYDSEILRVLNTLPKWVPAKKNGKAVDALYPLKISLKSSKMNGSALDTIKAEIVLPQFPGGKEGLIAYVKKNLKYPKESARWGIQGRVIVSFIVGREGSVKNATIVRGVDDYCDAEALRIVNNMPKWIPGTKNGVPADAYQMLPISYSFRKDKKKDIEKSSN